MKLATLRQGTRDGSLMVVNRSLTMMAGATKIAPTMQAALDDWENVAPALGALFEALERNDAEGALPFDADLLAAPLPRAFGWIDEIGRASCRARVGPDV